MMGAISRISSSWNANAMISSQFPLIKSPNPSVSFHSLSTLSTFSQLHFSLHSSNFSRRRTPPPTLLTLKASTAPTTPSVGSAEYTEEPATKVKFQTSLSLPSSSAPLSLLGTGYRERVFAIIGVKVYAAGLYVNPSIISTLNAWNGQSAAEIQENSALFSSIFQAPFEKSLQIVLVRDVDGKDFWNALDEAISPRIKAPTPLDESALSTFRSIFQGQPLKNGTLIFLTWLDSSKMLVCVSPDGKPSGADATIESASVTLALFDVFFGDAPVSPSLKASVANGLATILK